LQLTRFFGVSVRFDSRLLRFQMSPRFRFWRFANGLSFSLE
jgi:hypothetical protein